MNHQDFDLSGLSPEQLNVFAALQDGRNILVTGGAGTGKSFLLNKIRECLRPAVTASTGIAALNISGCTLHSWSGYGIGRTPPGDFGVIVRTSKAPWHESIRYRMQRAKLLCLDEVSMMDARYLEAIDTILQIVRNDKRPFGGLQIAFFGDFLQLPPVAQDGRQRYAFQSPLWEAANIETHFLTKVYRQEDEFFASILARVRIGQLDSEVADFLQSRFTPDPNPTIRGVIVHTHNAGADQTNATELGELVSRGAESRSYLCNDWAIDEHAHKVLDQCVAPNILNVCVGAQVMLLKNVNVAAGLANGSLGRVTALSPNAVSVQFYDQAGNPTIHETIGVAEWEFARGQTEIIARRRQIPLRLAWAITIHKSQGMSLDKIEAHLSRCFAPGQAYVALSRARTAAGLFIGGGPNVNIITCPHALDFYSK